ncbi:DUF4262 domain-containing protein [Dactylosporangium aurantiacum]|uniref:DUF4262 domain-containing protein n=2 Tax=Dactylosporangium aurantiacum TaxID=35754 RepID=A0A9Q9INU3_9ACTN|nr:DUF4262 domain-containing protein [Dactylosporangium aurantiacum]UWZ59106.1 DUF4262 domain-containing protein [Dactylosporangium aurantiacum]
MNGAANPDRRQRLDRMHADIATHGLSVTLVAGGALPRYAYTVGLKDVTGSELIMCGAYQYTSAQVHQIINAVGSALRADPATTSLVVGAAGVFRLRPVHSSWSRPLALGAQDFFGTDDVRCSQVVPDLDHMTDDVPDMTVEWAADREPAWQWIHRPWDLPVARTAVVTTNLPALRGTPVTELARWEDDEWEMFAGNGPDVIAEDVRVVPFGTMVGLDPSLTAAAGVRIGEGLWRDGPGSAWHPWRRRES